jgi:DNA-binding CsgD family transcriptional regulator
LIIRLNGISYLYDMLEYLGYLIFILTVAMAAGGVVLTSRLRYRYHHEMFSILLYFQVFIYTFGFYGIWGQAVIRVYLAKYISADLLSRLSDFAMLIGLPFVIFAWMMIIQFSCGASGRKLTRWFIMWFLLVNFSIIALMGYAMAKMTSPGTGSLIKYYFIIMQFIYSSYTSLLILFPVKGNSVIHDFDRKRIGPALVIAMLLQCVPLLFYTSQPYLALFFIFSFFAGNTFLPVYLNYGTLFTVFASEPEKVFSLEEFCKKYEVSPRETDIVREICNGLSNKEISEKLFISLQTVKDHTHRIYIKTNVRSRVQLIYLVKELKII